MRRFTSGSGLDTTSTVNGVLTDRTNPNFTTTPLIKTLFVIQLSRWNGLASAPGNTGSPFIPPWGGFGSGMPIGTNFNTSFLLTDYGAAVTYTPLGTFQAAVVHHGTMGCEVGIQQQKFDVVWSPRTTDNVLDAKTIPLLSAFPAITVLQGVNLGFFDGALISVYKTVMPTPGDVNTYGVSLIHSGFVDEIQLDGGQITFSCIDPIAHLNNQLPSQLIGPNSRFAAVDPMMYAASGLYLQGFAAKAGTTGQQISFTLSTLTHPPTGWYDGGIFIWTAGALQGMTGAIVKSTWDSTNRVFILQLARPFPFNPNDFAPGFSSGLPAAAAALRPADTSDALYNGFQNVPTPTQAY